MSVKTKTVRGAASAYGRSQVRKLSDSSLVAFGSIMGVERRHLAPYIIPVCCNAPVLLYVSCHAHSHTITCNAANGFHLKILHIMTDSCPFRQN
jgi:hypothetical protein